MVDKNPPSSPYQRRQDQLPRHSCCGVAAEKDVLQEVDNLLALLDHIERQILRLPMDYHPPTCSQFVAPPHNQHEAQDYIDIFASPFSSWSARSVKRFHLASFLRGVASLREGLLCCAAWWRHETTTHQSQSTDKGSTVKSSDGHEMVDSSPANTTNSNSMGDTPTGRHGTQDTFDSSKSTSKKKRHPRAEPWQDTVALLQRALSLLQDVDPSNWISLTPHLDHLGKILVRKFCHPEEEQETRTDRRIQSPHSLEDGLHSVEYRHE